MNEVRRFFRRYIGSTIGILVLFLAINVLLVALYFAIASLNGVADSKFPIERFSQDITMPNGTISADETAQETLRSFDAWAMILDDNGTVVWEERLPDDLPRHYTATEIALFSHWYLEGYPVDVWRVSNGLLVVGFPPGDVFKYNASFRTAYIEPLMIGLAIALLANVLLMLFLFWRNARRVEKAMLPILDGIRALPGESEVNLSENGELAEIKAALNHAGASLRQRDTMRSDWIRGVSHDVRTPLSVILGYASDMEEDESLAAPAREQAAAIRKQGERLRALVADLNLSARLEYGNVRLQKERIDPVELERQVASEFLNEGIPEAFTIKVSARQAMLDALPPLYGDATLLRRMLCNLVSNSIVHNPEGCEIELSASITDNRYAFSVTDTGCGMDERRMERLNTEGAVCSTQPESKCGEHGLGLKIVGQIADAHRGKVVFSGNVPNGLCVKVII